MGKQKSFQQVLQIFVEKLQKLNKTAIFPHTFSSNLYTKNCIFVCDFALKLLFYVLSLVYPQVFLSHSRNWCLSVHSLDKKDAACSVSPESFRFLQTCDLTVYLKTRKDTAIFCLQRNPDQPVHDHWHSCFYLATFKKVITKNVENL